MKLNDAISTVESNFSSFKENMARINELYPKMMIRNVPLSITGISPRVFFNWKKMGIVDHEVSENGNRTWVRLNLYQYVWLELCKSLRDFGIPIASIKTMKDQIFSSLFQELIDNKEEFLKTLEVESVNPEEHTRALNIITEVVPGLMSLLSKEERIVVTQFGSGISAILVDRAQITLYIHRLGDQFFVRLIPEELIPQLGDTTSFFSNPFLRIPLNPIVTKFLDEPDKEQYLLQIGLFNPEEMKVLSAVRKKDFKEIVIKSRDGGKSLVIEKVRDMDLFEEKVKELKRVIGLKDYEEITLTHRNKKHIHVTIKSRI